MSKISFPDMGNRFLSALSALIVLTFLAACGGGGGGTDGPTNPGGGGGGPAPVTGSLKVNETCEIPDGSRSCVTKIEVDTTASAGELKVGSKTYPVAAGKSTVEVKSAGIGTIDVQLYSSSGAQQPLDTAKVTKSCSSNAAWDKLENPDGVCMQKLCYTEVVTALMGANSTIRIVKKDEPDPDLRVQLPRDATGWARANADGWVPPPGKCGWAVNDNPDRVIGRIRGVCQHPWDLTWYRVVFDPVKEEVRTYGGEVPDSELTTANYVDVGEFSGLFPGWALHTELADGWLGSGDGVTLPLEEIWWQPKGEPLPAQTLVYRDPLENGALPNIKRLDTWTNNCNR